MTRGVSISNLGPTLPQHPSSRGASTLATVAGSTGPVLPSWRLQKVAGGLIQFEGLRLPGVIGGLPFRTPRRGPRWPTSRWLAAPNSPIISFFFSYLLQIALFSPFLLLYSSLISWSPLIPCPLLEPPFLLQDCLHSTVAPPPLLRFNFGYRPPAPAPA